MVGSEGRCKRQRVHAVKLYTSGSSDGSPRALLAQPESMLKVKDNLELTDIA
jgi:hypothetical protein